MHGPAVRMSTGTPDVWTLEDVVSYFGPKIMVARTVLCLAFWHLSRDRAANPKE